MNFHQNLVENCDATFITQMMQSNGFFLFTCYSLNMTHVNCPCFHNDMK